MSTTPRTTVKTYSFTVTLAGLPTPDPGLDDTAWNDQMDTLLDNLTGRVLAAGLEEAGVNGTGSCGEEFSLNFDREAGSLAEAVGSAIADLERAGFAVARIEVESDRP
jgi:hypothetical protein